MFAVFLAQPCPFYILDEVEAALDDINIDRFLQLVKRYSDRAQFIVVTHQKRTMDAADTLYGVSMGGDGISRVVSRKLAGAAAAGSTRRAAAERARPSRASMLARPMARSWHELFLTGEDAPPAVPEADAEPERRGFFRRLRENMSKTRQALGAELQATVFQSLDDEAFEHLEETLIYADVGAPTTAKIVERLELEAESGELQGGEDLSRRLRELLADTARIDGDTIDLRRRPDGDPGGGGERQRQDDHDRQDRLAPAAGARPLRAARGGRHLPRRRRRAARPRGPSAPAASSCGASRAPTPAP